MNPELKAFTDLIPAAALVGIIVFWLVIYSTMNSAHHGIRRASRGCGNLMGIILLLILAIALLSALGGVK